MKKILLIIIFLCFIPFPVSAKDNLYVSYQSAALFPEDDNFGYGKGFFAQGAETGYSFNKYIEAGAEWYISALKTLHKSTFIDNSVMGTVKIKYPIPIKKLDRVIPYACFGVGAHIFSDEDMKIDPDQLWNNINPPEKIHNKTCIALKYSAGVQFKITDNVFLFSEISYRYGDTGDPSTLDIYAWSYGGGAKIYF